MSLSSTDSLSHLGARDTSLLPNPQRVFFFFLATPFSRRFLEDAICPDTVWALRVVCKSQGCCRGGRELGPSLLGVPQGPSLSDPPGPDP